MLDANSFAALLVSTGTSSSPVVLGTVTGVSGTTVSFVLDGEASATATRSAATFVGFDPNTAAGARVVLCRINSSWVVLGVLQ